MIDTQAIKNKILDLAICGRLTERLEGEETGAEVISQIRREREDSAVKAKSRGRAAVPLNSVVNSTPFELPFGWAWIPLETIGADVPNAFADGPFGSNLKKEHYTVQKQVRIIQLSNVGVDGWRNANEKYTTYEHLATIQRSEVKAGNIVIAKMMPAGRAIIVPHGVADAFVLSSDCVKFVPHPSLNAQYLCYAINSKWFHDQVMQDVHGIGRERTSLSNLKRYYLPIPSIGEQARIVAAMDKVSRILNDIDLLQAQYAENLSLLKCKLIDVAIQGKLTKQLPEDGTAEELYWQVQEERKRQENAGTIKTVELAPGIKEEEKPFAIPSNWKWTRLGNVSYIVRGGSPRPIKEYITTREDGINWIKIGDVEKGGKYIYSTHEKIIPEGESKSRRVYPGDFLLTNSMSFGRPYISKIEGCIHDGWLLIHGLNGFDSDYLYYLLSSTYLYGQFTVKASGSTVDNLNIDKVKDAIIPLPPLAEQKRIAHKIDELLPLFEK